MKDLGWILLLLSGCLLIALAVALLVEMLDLPFLKEPHPEQTTLTQEPGSAIDESTIKPTTKTIASTEQLTKSSDINRRTANNLLVNASFEQNPTRSAPLWNISGLGNKHVVEWTTEQAATGQHALKISASKPSKRGWPGWVTRLDHTSVRGYQLQAKYFSTDGANAWLEISFLDANNRLIKGYSTGCPRQSVKNQWTPMQQQIKAENIPDETRSLQVGLRQCLNHTKGRRTTLYFDDVALFY